MRSFYERISEFVWIIVQINYRYIFVIDLSLEKLLRIEVQFVFESCRVYSKLILDNNYLTDALFVVVLTLLH